ncbi:MAG: ATP-binding protein [Candidatus Omnitrophica bacterium]|nr:ATP-binding protein [Candidatus Omnitrophota bacterium]MDD5670332.1 ATP-binding protein [Candidatus Omnitrophota bacterium]
MAQGKNSIKQIVIISGKGGTGKTMLSASFAVLAGSKVMVDCDVDAANLYLLLQPAVVRSEEFKGSSKAQVDKNVCVQCGQCQSVCRFDAITDDYAISTIDCEGCGLCVRMCPVNAISMKEVISGEWFISDTQYGPFVHAKLGVAEGNSGKLVSLIRQAAVQIAEEQRKNMVIIDGPPGIGCPVIASLSGTDLAVVVTEPTPAGIHDMERIFSLARHFKIPLRIVINKFDLNLENSKFIDAFAGAHEIEVIGRIPFSAQVSKAIVQGVPPVEFCRDGVRQEIISIWEKLERI